MYLRVRLPAIKVAGGGVHKSGKGGPHDRNKEKEKIRREVKAELN